MNLVWKTSHIIYINLGKKNNGELMIDLKNNCYLLKKKKKIVNINYSTLYEFNNIR